MQVKIHNLSGDEIGDIELSDDVFGKPVRVDLLHRVVNWQLAKRQAGTHKTKGVSEIAGRGARPYRQKGTGRARQGSTRSPQFRGGATIFGPVVRSHAHDLPKKVRKLGLKTALSAKVAEQKLIVIDTVGAETPKTKDLVSQLAPFGWDSVLFIDTGIDGDSKVNFARALQNIPKFDYLPTDGANVYDILRRNTLVISKDAVHLLEARLGDAKEPAPVEGVEA